MRSLLPRAICSEALVGTPNSSSDLQGHAPAEATRLGGSRNLNLPACQSWVNGSALADARSRPISSVRPPRSEEAGGEKRSCSRRAIALATIHKRGPGPVGVRVDDRIRPERERPKLSCFAGCRARASGRQVPARAYANHAVRRQLRREPRAALLIRWSAPRVRFWSRRRATVRSRVPQRRQSRTGSDAIGRVHHARIWATAPVSSEPSERLDPVDSGREAA
jgi:hypothetical protein